MIQVKGLGKQYGEQWVVKEFQFGVRPGEFLGILGRNGAGKTTLVRMLTGQLKPTQGEISILGQPVADRPLDLRKNIGVMPEPSALLDRLTGNQYLDFAGQIHGLEPRLLKERIQELGALLEIDFHLALRIGDYSYGMKKKVALSVALLHAPKVVFLDEPFEGLDPVCSETLKGLLASLHDHGTTLVMTSHLLGIAERLCTRFLVIDQGRKIADASTASLLQDAKDLESLFLNLVGKPKPGGLSWM